MNKRILLSVITWIPIWLIIFVGISPYFDFNKGRDVLMIFCIAVLAGLGYGCLFAAIYEFIDHLKNRD